MNMIDWRIHRLLYRLIILTLFVIALWSIFTTYWANKDRHNKKLSYSNVPIATSKESYNEQNTPILESSILKVTPVSITHWNKITKSRLPWYFRDGTKLPDRAQVNPKTRVRTPCIWPEEQMDGDRVEEQLMFVPTHYQYENAPMKTILLYNDFNKWLVDEGQIEFRSKDCPVNRCSITSRIKRLPDVDAVIFREKYSNFPSGKKNRKQIWIFFTLESVYYSDLSVQHDMINWTATYRHDSDIVVPFGRWANYNSLLPPVGHLKRNYAQNKTKQVAMIVSNCDTDNYRLLYAKELSKYISVDLYGKCGDFETSKSDNFLRHLEQDYKFYLAFESTNCIDYVTEKFFIDGLQHNALPIVMGGRREDYERVAPEGSYLHVDDYESPEKLAGHLRRLDADDDLYNEYFRWKGTGEFIDTKFFCRLCAMLHDDGAPAKYYADVNRWWYRRGVCDHSTGWQRFVGEIPSSSKGWSDSTEPDD